MNARGSVLIGALVLVPVLISIFIVVAATYLMLRSDGRSRHACRVELLRSQEKVSRLLTQLIELNPKAAALRLEREVAEREVALTIGEPANVAAQANLALVIAKQTVHAIKQQKLITAARMESRLGPSRASQEIRTTLSLDQSAYQAGEARSFSFKTKTGAFDLIATPSDSITPDYQPSARFMTSQNMQVEWQLDLKSLLPAWIADLLPTEGLALKAECSATLQKGTLKWSPILNVDKP